ncbi:ubiquitin carboxyl-terminal hydrolase 19 [Mytilus galloprovincialis]|uniref:Ubiquitin carboxyl-terminal hydrolase 19 n=1 Tax=Mytilus galloprovincialis TaxID=29158 RepID=A0A8B6BMZ1_MYTGA|nr:ubiquitin carboxyl-terminal hydrolase 19 [Mytilus galloprovincialis]
MCFTCFGDHKGHKIDDVKKVCERYKSKMELTLLPGLHMKQRQLEGAVEHWNGIMNTEQAGRQMRNDHISKEIKLLKNMLNEYMVDRISGMIAYNCKMTNQLISQCENKKKIVEKDLINVKKLISDIISDTDPARTLLTFTEITKRGDHDIEKLSDYAMDLPKKAIHMTLDPIWRKKLEEFSNSFKMTISGVEEDNIELPEEILDEKKIFSLNNLPYSIKITEMEEQIKALIPLKNVMSLDCMFDRQKVMVHFSTLNVGFLSLHKDTTPETVFGWEIKLQREIQPIRSSSKVTEKGIEINLIKAKKEQWEILERAASPIISESSELTQNDSTSVDYTTQSSQPCQSPKPSTSYGSCVTAGSKKRPSMDGSECPSNTNSGRKKRKSFQNSEEQVEDLLKEMVDKKEIEHFITTKVCCPLYYKEVCNSVTK